MSHNFWTTIRKVKQLVIEDIQAGLVSYLRSSPGIGKSAIVKQIAKEYNLKLIDHRLSTSMPEDMSGLPDMKGEKATFKPFDYLPIEGIDEVPPGYNGWLLFLDEFNSAGKTVMAAAYKLILDKEVGQRKLHPNVAIVCAGNLDTDRAITNVLSTAMQSRVITYLINFNFKEWMDDVVYKEGWDPRIIAFLNYKPEYAMDFRPDHNDLTFSCPRTWEFMNRHLDGKEFDTIYNEEDGTYYFTMMDKAPKYAGTITSGVAAEFITFCEVGAKMPKIKQILADPLGTEVPLIPEIAWCTITHCVENVTDKNLEDLTMYINRFAATFRVLFFRSMFVRHPTLRHHRAVGPAALELAKYLRDV